MRSIPKTIPKTIPTTIAVATAVLLLPFAAPAADAPRQGVQASIDFAAKQKALKKAPKAKVEYMRSAAPPEPKK
jgi:hypothetical protein